jgi:putative transposase
VRAFSYLLQPTVRQSVALAELFDVQRELYNAALEERRGAWSWERRNVSRFETVPHLDGVAAGTP